MKSTIWNKEIAFETAKVLIENGSYLVYFSQPKEKWVELPSGVKIPCYCNCRYLINNQKCYQRVLSFLETTIRIKFPQGELISGLATAGIPWASVLGSRLNLPICYVRSKSKGHGVGRFVEGNPREALKAILIDDACDTGQSLIRAMNTLKNEYSISTVGIVTIASLSDWGFDNLWDEFKRRKVQIYSLTNYDYLIRIAIDNGLLTEGQSSMLRDFYKSPKTYKWIH